MYDLIIKNNKLFDLINKQNGQQMQLSPYELINLIFHNNDNMWNIRCYNLFNSVYLIRESFKTEILTNPTLEIKRITDFDYSQYLFFKCLYMTSESNINCKTNNKYISVLPASFYFALPGYMEYCYLSKNNFQEDKEQLHIRSNDVSNTLIQHQETQRLISEVLDSCEEWHPAAIAEMMEKIDVLANIEIDKFMKLDIYDYNNDFITKYPFMKQETEKQILLTEILKNKNNILFRELFGESLYNKKVAGNKYIDYEEILDLYDFIVGKINKFRTNKLEELKQIKEQRKQNSQCNRPNEIVDVSKSYEKRILQAIKQTQSTTTSEYYYYFIQEYIVARYLTLVHGYKRDDKTFFLTDMRRTENDDVEHNRIMASLLKK
jgi:hypothetical protein